MYFLAFIATLFALTTTYFVLRYWIAPAVRRKRSTRKHLDEYLDEDSKLEVVYTSETDKGKARWYAYKNPLNLPPGRSWTAELATTFAELCMTPRDFDQAMTKMKAAINKNDLAKCGQIVGNLVERRNLAAEMSSLEELAHAYFMLEGEPTQKCSPEWFKRKKEIWNQDPACHAFFLHKAMAIIRDIKDLSESDLHLFLRATEKSLQKLT